MSAPHPMTQVNDLLVMTSGLPWKSQTWFLLLRPFEFLPQICTSRLRPLPPALPPIMQLPQCQSVEAPPGSVSPQYYARVVDGQFWSAGVVQWQGCPGTPLCASLMYSGSEVPVSFLETRCSESFFFFVLLFFF